MFHHRMPTALYSAIVRFVAKEWLAQVGRYFFVDWSVHWLVSARGTGVAVNVP